MVLGKALEPKPGPQEAPRGPNIAKHIPYQNLGNDILWGVNEPLRT